MAHRLAIRLANSRDSIKTAHFIINAIIHGRFRAGIGRLPLLINLIKQGR